MDTNLPLARRTALVVQPIDQELVLYDTKTDKANLLNHTAAWIWKHCDGETTIPELAAQLSRELGTTVDESLVWHTLDHLDRKGLLAERPAVPAAFRGMTRRDLLRGGLAGAVVLLPVIVSLTAPDAASAQSGCLQFPAPCDPNNPGACCSGTCAICGDNCNICA